MAFLKPEELLDIGFKHLGRNVRISDRAAIHNADQISIGDNSRIDDFCVISGIVTIGRNVHVSVFCNIAGGEEGITLEDFAGVSCGVHIFTRSDDYGGGTLTNPTVPDEYKKVTKKAVIIKKHSIVGSNSIIFPGVILAEGTSLGALTLVMKSTEPWSVYVGQPARRLHSRRCDLLVKEKEYLELDDVEFASL